VPGIAPGAARDALERLVGSATGAAEPVAATGRATA
jgi:hypothetical protein